ncbi:hypothetical protein ACFQ60_48095 [Streptomyces zhihengii]
MDDLITSPPTPTRTFEHWPAALSAPPPTAVPCQCWNASPLMTSSEPLWLPRGNRRQAGLRTARRIRARTAST